MTRREFVRVSTLVALFAIACRSNGGRRGVEHNGMAARGAFAAQPIVAGDIRDATISAYVTLENAGDTDTLDAIATPAATKGGVHVEMQHGGMGMMMPEEVVEVPGHGTLRLSPGGRHIMLEGLTSRPAAGDTLTITLRFRRAGALVVPIPVVSYAALDSAARASGR